VACACARARPSGLDELLANDSIFISPVVHTAIGVPERRV
jgi:hypothetical protein